MIKELQLRILPEEAVNEQSLRQVVARETGEAPKNIRAVRVLKRSIDARQRTIFVNVKLRVFMNEMPSEPEYQSIEYKDVSAGKPVIRWKEENDYCRRWSRNRKNSCCN